MTPEELTELRSRADAAPHDFELQVAAASGCDTWGREEDAIVYYDRAYPMLGELPAAAKRWELFLGYGSTLRNVKRLDESRAILEAAIAEWPDNSAFPAFLALTLLDMGEADRAVALLVDTLLVTGKDAPEIIRCSRSLGYYRDELRARSSSG
jgi:thioredoxin-like negative regulator of GroEL